MAFSLSVPSPRGSEPLALVHPVPPPEGQGCLLQCWQLRHQVRGWGTASRLPVDSSASVGCQRLELADPDQPCNPAAVDVPANTSGLGKPRQCLAPLPTLPVFILLPSPLPASPLFTLLPFLHHPTPHIAHICPISPPYMTLHSPHSHAHIACVCPTPVPTSSAFAQLPSPLPPLP